MDPSTIGDIPPEILLGILRNLPIPSLKNARLACKQWTDVGARCLFSRIYFAPRHENMKVFTNITENAAFASNIETIIYDARLFWRHMETPAVYRAAQRRRFPDDFFERIDTFDTFDFDDPPSEAAYLESSTRYSNLLRAQTGIFDAQEDLDVLRTGLQRLPNLKQISVLDRFCAWLDFAPFLWAANEFQWYLDWLGEFRPSIANPSTWSDANCGLEGTALDDAPWDLRGITNLLAAVEEDAPHLRDFYLGCQASKLSADIYFREENVRSLCKIAPRLTSFKMELDMPGFDPDLPPIDHFQKVEDILQKMLSLSSLSFAFHRAPGDAFEVFWNLKLPHLTMLDLGDGYWELDNVETLVKAHVDTLRELRLRNMCIMEGGSWENVATNLGQSLQLHMVSLMSLADKTRESVYLDDDDVQETARLFMQRTPDHLFGVHVSTGAAIAWHKQTFKPTYDFDSVLAQTP